MPAPYASPITHVDGPVILLWGDASCTHTHVDSFVVVDLADGVGGPHGATYTPGLVQ
jgi:hypothetical protein